MILSTVDLTGTGGSLRAGQMKKTDSYKMGQAFVSSLESDFRQLFSSFHYV